MLYIDLRPGQTCHSKDSRSAYSVGVGELGWQYGTGLKSHGTVTNWCTGRGWPVNCMIVISARWRSKTCHSKGVGAELLYLNAQEIQPVFLRSESLETRCGRESQHPAESCPPRASGWAALENRKETLMTIRVGRSIGCSSVRSPTPSHTQPFQIKWEVHIFLKNCVARLYDSACICRCICIMCLYS